MLHVKGVSVRFGGVVALDNVSLEIKRGSFCGIIGPNGAGKTTLFNAIFGLVPLATGEILVNSRSIASSPPHKVVSLGVARTFQNLGIFPHLTVAENIIAGGLSRHRIPILSDVLGLSVGSARQKLCDRAREISAICGLEKYYEHEAAVLPFGLQKRVELGRALAAEPSILLLDEPAGGLSHGEVEQFISLLAAIRSSLQLTIVMIEHHLGLVMRVSEHVIVLNFGRVISDGRPSEVRSSPEVIAAYLGTDE